MSHPSQWSGIFLWVTVGWNIIQFYGWIGNLAIGKVTETPWFWSVTAPFPDLCSPVIFAFLVLFFFCLSHRSLNLKDWGTGKPVSSESLVHWGKGFLAEAMPRPSLLWQWLTSSLSEEWQTPVSIPEAWVGVSWNPRTYYSTHWDLPTLYPPKNNLFSQETSRITLLSCLVLHAFHIQKLSLLVRNGIWG